MILLKTLRSSNFTPSPSLPLQIRRTLASSAETPPPSLNPNPKTLSSLFLNSNRKKPKEEIKPKPKEENKEKAEEGEMKKTKRTASHFPMEVKEFPKEFSPDAASLLERLIGDGYLKGANFLKVEEEKQQEPHQIPSNYYSRCFLASAAERFGTDHQEIAKWLSGSHLKEVALFGCPSIERKSVFAAKRLRSFFHIHEDNTCRVCKLSTSCSFKNQKVGAVEKVILGDVTRLLMVYMLNSVPKDLRIPGKLNFSIDKLLKEVVCLTK